MTSRWTPAHYRALGLCERCGIRTKTQPCEDCAQELATGKFSITDLLADCELQSPMQFTPDYKRERRVRCLCGSLFYAERGVRRCHACREYSRYVTNRENLSRNRGRR